MILKTIRLVECDAGVTFITYTLYLKTVLCKGLVIWEVTGKGNQLLKYVRRQQLKVQNKDVQEYYHITPNLRCTFFFTFFQTEILVAS